MFTAHPKNAMLNLSVAKLSGCSSSTIRPASQSILKPISQLIHTVTIALRRVIWVTSVHPFPIIVQNLTSLQHCPDPQRNQDCPEEPSSHNVDHLINGLYGRSYQEHQRLAQPGQTLFGDLLVDKEDMTGVGGDFQFNHGSVDDVTPFAQPGRAGREKQMQRLVRQQPHRDEEEDWFNNQRRDHGRLRQQQQPPSRNVQVNYRSSGPVLDAQYYHAPPPPPPPYAPLPLPPAPTGPPPPMAMVPPPPIYFDGAPAGPRPRGYPPPHEIAVGYRRAPLALPQPGAPKPELSIRGAAQRRQEQERDQRGTGGRDKGGKGQEWDRVRTPPYQDGRPGWNQRSGYRNNRRHY